MDTFLRRNARTCRMKVRQTAGRGEQKERTRGRGARVTESIVEAYWESANSPGFNLTGEPWTPFNIQARARRLVASRASATQQARETPRSTMPFSLKSEEWRRRERKLSGYSILAELSSNLFIRAISHLRVNVFWIFSLYILVFFPSFILRHFFLSPSSFINIL